MVSLSNQMSGPPFGDLLTPFDRLRVSGLELVFIFGTLVAACFMGTHHDNQTERCKA